MVLLEFFGKISLTLFAALVLVSFCRVGLRQVVESIIAQQEEKMQNDALYQVRQTEQTEGGGYFL